MDKIAEDEHTLSYKSADNGAVENKQASSLESHPTLPKETTDMIPDISGPPCEITVTENSPSDKSDFNKLRDTRKTHKRKRGGSGTNEKFKSELPTSILELEKLPKKYSCSEAGCSRKFVMKEELENHKKQHGTFQCQGCPKTKDFAQALSAHEITHTSQSSTDDEDPLLRCFRCDYSTRVMSLYVRHHMKTHLQVPTCTLICPICRHPFNSNSHRRQNQLNNHFKEIHDVSDMDPKSVPKCSQCSAFFRTDFQLQTHKSKVCKNLKNYCSDCGKNFPRKSTFIKHRLKWHVQITTPLPHKCNVENCGKLFETKLDVESHTKFCHPAGEDFKVVCPTCGKEVMKAFLNSHIYSVHKRVYPEKTRKICETCGKSFANQWRLNLHCLTHVGPEHWKFSCSICGRKCRDKAKLKEHENTHTKEKPFVCQVCGVAYAHRHNLRIHVNNKHSKIIKDIARPRDTTNWTSRKGIKCKPAFDKVSDSIQEENVN